MLTKALKLRQGCCTGRGIAKRNGDKLVLLLDDYPFAEDGLLVWNALEEYFTEYLNLYYSDSGADGKPKARSSPQFALARVISDAPDPLVGRCVQ